MNPWAVIDQVRAAELAGQLQQLEQLYPRFAFTLRGQWWCARNKRTGLELLRLSRAASAVDVGARDPQPAADEGEERAASAAGGVREISHVIARRLYEKNHLIISEGPDGLEVISAVAGKLDQAAARELGLVILRWAARGASTCGCEGRLVQVQDYCDTWCNGCGRSFR